MELATAAQDNAQSIHYIPILFGIAITLVQCFFGFKLFRYIMGFWGFALFGYVGYTIGIMSGNQTAALAVCFILGAVGAFIAYKFYKAGVFLQGLIAGFIIGFIIASFAGFTTAAALAFGVVLGILIGLLTIYILKPLIILTSAISGGMASGVIIAGFLNFPKNAGVLIGLFFAALGIGYQFYSIGKDKGIKHKKEKDEKKDKKDKKDKKQKGVSDEVPGEESVADNVAVAGTAGTEAAPASGAEAAMSVTEISSSEHEESAELDNAPIEAETAEEEKEEDATKTPD